jgi:hypothetical protein
LQTQPGIYSGAPPALKACPKASEAKKDSNAATKAKQELNTAASKESELADHTLYVPNSFKWAK